MKQEKINEHARRMLGVAKGVLKRCRTTEARRKVRKTIKYYKDVIKLAEVK